MRVGLLAAYCLVMILPAIVLATATATLGQRFLPRLVRLAARLEYETTVTLLWIAAIAGFYLAAGSATALGLFGR